MQPSTSTPTSKLIAARDVRQGATLVDHRCKVLMKVLRVLACADGSVRLVTEFGEQRMTPSVSVRVLH